MNQTGTRNLSGSGAWNSGAKRVTPHAPMARGMCASRHGSHRGRTVVS